VIDFVARQVGVDGSEVGSYEWSGSTMEYHRAQIRAHLGFRVATVADQEKMTAWLAVNVAHAERRPERPRPVRDWLRHHPTARLRPAATNQADQHDPPVPPGHRAARRVPQLTQALTRPIRWDLIEQNYDQMIKYATAIRQGTASTEAILRRFTRSASHPTYQAMLEVGRAQRTIFAARFLRSRELQREITEGLNIVEAFNGANSLIYYGKGGEIASNRQDEQEMTALCLRILQAALV
jgi:hypothetical protein